MTELTIIADDKETVGEGKEANGGTKSQTPSYTSSLDSNV